MKRHPDRRAVLALAAATLFGLTGGRASAAVQRVVALDLLATELLLTLGVTPLAIANRALYVRLVAEPRLPDSVEDLGPLTEPNAEFLKILRPETIVLANWQVGALQRLSAIAPFHPLAAPPRNVPALAQLVETLRDLGQLVGRAAEAEDWITRLKHVLAETKTVLASRNARPLYVCRFAANGRNVAIFGGNGLIGDTLHALGLGNAWQGRVNGSGVASIGIDQLASPDVRIIHFDRGAETVRALENLTQSPLWNALPAVRLGRVSVMPVIYPSGGVFSAIRFARQLAATLPREDGHG